MGLHGESRVDGEIFENKIVKLVLNLKCDDLIKSSFYSDCEVRSRSHE